MVKPQRYANILGHDRNGVRLSQYKLCNACNQILPISDFGKHKRYKDGLQLSCHVCIRSYRAEWKQNKLLIDPDYFARESRNRRINNPDKDKEYKRKWRENNLDKARLSARLYARKKYIDDSDSMRLYQSEWRSKNKTKTVLNKQIRRVRIKSGGVFYVSEKEIAKLYSTPCLSCGSKNNIEIDHVIPVSRGGTNSVGNLVALCRPCNRSKGNRTYMEWKLFKMKDVK